MALLNPLKAKSYEAKVRQYLRDRLRLNDHLVSREQDNALIKWAEVGERIGVTTTATALNYAAILHEEFLTSDDHRDVAAACSIRGEIAVEIRVTAARGEIGKEEAVKLLGRLGARR